MTGVKSRILHSCRSWRSRRIAPHPIQDMDRNRSCRTRGSAYHRCIQTLPLVDTRSDTARTLSWCMYVMRGTPEIGSTQGTSLHHSFRIPWNETRRYIPSVL